VNVIAPVIVAVHVNVIGPVGVIAPVDVDSSSLAMCDPIRSR